MSLFSSAFDGGPGLAAGPSSLPLRTTLGVSRAKAGGSNKPSPSLGSKKGKSAGPGVAGSTGQHVHPDRLRNTLGMPQQKHKKRRRSEARHDERLGSTQRNVDQIMSRLEAGVQEDRGDSRPMGMATKQKKNKKGNGGSDGRNIEVNGHGSASKASTQGTNAKGKQREDALTSPDHKASKKRLGEAHMASVTGSGRSGLPKGSLDDAKPLLGSRDDQAVDADLTKMQKSMRTKLEEARFRWINEQLYSNSSKEALAMMKMDPKVFSDYHSTHRVLTSAWPTPPLPFILEKLNPLPAKTVIVDLGCGDATLARTLVPQGKVVLSYDLVGDSGERGFSASVSRGWVIEADFLDHVPLPGRPGGLVWSDDDGSEALSTGSDSSEIVDVVVCCLSLMGTNWVGGIYEACRILKQGGTFHIAEVTSRFESTDRLVSIVKSFGFSLINQSSPSTHFTLFEFKKTSPVPQGPAKGEDGWDKRLEKGPSIMKGCVYKKR